MFSKSEQNGLNAILWDAQRIYSVGISTGGKAEVEMIKGNPDRCVIATTLDQEGAQYASKRIRELGLTERVEVKIEDVAGDLPYLTGYFDFIYARLVLHYLPKKALEYALKELYRILRKGGRLFIVVRSVECPEAQGENSTLDIETGLTTYSSKATCYQRYFHTSESICYYVESAGFIIDSIQTYSEHLCSDFQRKKPAQHIDHLIELIAVKKFNG